MDAQPVFFQNPLAPLIQQYRDNAVTIENLLKLAAILGVGYLIFFRRVSRR